MGIAFSFLPFFDSCHRRQALQSPFLALGSLELHEPEDAVISFARKHSYKNFLREKSLRSLFQDRYGIESYHDCDINKKADIDCDLSLPVNFELMNFASTILDGGTLEHIFDVRQALHNIHNMLKVGGVIIHISPLTWYNHAFYNFNPKLFQGVIKANNYELLVEAFWLSRNTMLGFGGNQGGKVYITFDGKEYPEIVKKIDKQMNSNSLPANSLYLIAYKKNGNDDFKNPYDL